MPAYMLIELTIQDREIYEEYMDRISAVVAQ